MYRTSHLCSVGTEPTSQHPLPPLSALAERGTQREAPAPPKHQDGASRHCLFQPPSTCATDHHDEPVQAPSERPTLGLYDQKMGPDALGICDGGLLDRAASSPWPSLVLSAPRTDEMRGTHLHPRAAGEAFVVLAVPFGAHTREQPFWTLPNSRQRRVLFDLLIPLSLIAPPDPSPAPS